MFGGILHYQRWVHAGGSLTEMKYLSFSSSGLPEIPSSICNLTQLLVLQIEYETKIEWIPHCIDNLQSLWILIVDGSFRLKDIPLSMFRLPDLSLLSLFKGSITYQSLLDYNLPDDINQTDTESVVKWFNNSFIKWLN